VEGAVANALANPVPEEVKEERRARFMAVQEKISTARLTRKVGKRMTVLVDEVEKNRAIARSPADAPEIDGVVYITNVKNMKAGEFAEVEIIGSDAHDLRARDLRAKFAQRQGNISESGR
jgi:ribosomal protein S12 methylthiotransferase